ncbi:MAG: hypothetical protein RIC55_21330 [Pirellulaceae bacterium]
MPRPDTLTRSTEPGQGQFVHSIDFHSMVWRGRVYEFTAAQAACVAVLFHAWKSGAPIVGGQTILVEAGLESKRLDQVFRNHPAWGEMIVHATRRGNYRLSER